MDTGVRADALQREVLPIAQHQAVHVTLGRLAAERHGAIDPEPDFGRTLICQIAAEAGRDFNDNRQFSAPHALLKIAGGVDRRTFGEMMQAGKALQQTSALRCLVLVVGGVLQVLDVERDSVAEGEHQNGGADESE